VVRCKSWFIIAFGRIFLTLIQTRNCREGDPDGSEA
jgi:hypothetical protein